MLTGILLTLFILIILGIGGLICTAIGFILDIAIVKIIIKIILIICVIAIAFALCRMIL